MGAAPSVRLSVEEYLALDRAAEVKSEYHDGELFPLSAVTLSHAFISAQVIGLINGQLAKTAGRVAISPLRVRVSPTRLPASWKCI